MINAVRKLIFVNYAIFLSSLKYTFFKTTDTTTNTNTTTTITTTTASASSFASPTVVGQGLSVPLLVELSFSDLPDLPSQYGNIKALSVTGNIFSGDVNPQLDIGSFLFGSCEVWSGIVQNECGLL